MKTTALADFLIIFTHLCFVGARAVLTQRPEGDVFGILYNTIDLNCVTNSSGPINWEFSFHGSTTYSWIFLNSLMTQTHEKRYKIDSSHGSYRLIIESVDWSYAGRYRCTDEAGLGEAAIAQLTVIDPMPKCFHNASMDQPLRSLCFSGVIFCAFSYLGEAVPTLTLTMDMYILKRMTNSDSSTRTPQRKVMALKDTLDQPCEKDGHQTENTKTSTNEPYDECILLMYFASDDQSLVTDEDVTATVTVSYRITSNHSTNIGLQLSFTSLFPAKLQCYHYERHVTSQASCISNDKTIGLSVFASLAALGFVVLSVYIVYLKRIITNFKRGIDLATAPHSAPGANLTQIHRYEDVEGDFSDSMPRTTGTANYDALGQRMPYKPGVYDRLKGARQSTQRAKHASNTEEKEVQVFSGASWDPDNSREEGRRKSQVEEGYMTLVA